MYVPVGSRLVYVATYAPAGYLTSGFSSNADDVAAITSQLANNDAINVEQSSIDSGITSSTVTITLNLLTSGTDYNSELDVKSIVDHYIYVQSGNMPDSSRIVSVTVPGSSPQATGAPGVPVDTTGSSLLSNLGTNIASAGTGFIIGGIAVIALLFWLAAKSTVTV